MKFLLLFFALSPSVYSQHILTHQKVYKEVVRYSFGYLQMLDGLKNEHVHSCKKSFGNHYRCLVVMPIELDHAGNEFLPTEVINIQGDRTGISSEVLSLFRLFNNNTPGITSIDWTVKVPSACREYGVKGYCFVLDTLYHDETLDGQHEKDVNAMLKSNLVFKLQNETPYIEKFSTTYAFYLVTDGKKSK